MDKHKNLARLAMAEAVSPDGVMRASIDSGHLVVGPATCPEEVESMLAGASLDQKAEDLGYSESMTDAQLDERTGALEDVIAQKMAWERKQIVTMVENYARDCDERCEAMLAEGKRARKKFRQDNKPDDGDRALEDCHRRAAAFKVRAAIALDIAGKIKAGWGREADGVVQ